jgi:hypothetical protein
MKRTFSLLVAGLISLAALTSCGNSSLPNYSGDGACDSLESLINQLGLMEIQDLDTFYSQIDAIIAQANTAAATDAKFGEMASQVQTFARVWMEKFPNAVPNYLGTIPLQATSDDFCGTDFASQG